MKIQYKQGAQMNRCRHQRSIARCSRIDPLDQPFSQSRQSQTLHPNWTKFQILIANIVNYKSLKFQKKDRNYFSSIFRTTLYAVVPRRMQAQLKNQPREGLTVISDFQNIQIRTWPRSDYDDTNCEPALQPHEVEVCTFFRSRIRHNKSHTEIQRRPRYRNLHSLSLTVSEPIDLAWGNI